MVDKIIYLEVEDGKFPMACTINTMEKIQNEYGSMGKWNDLVMKPKNGEPDIRALKFFFTASINEGIDIENKKLNKQREHISADEAGRIITEVGFSDAYKNMGTIISDSLPAETKGKNVKTTKSQMAQ
ncbi:MAG: hypothetical protein RUMPE_01354 [Eubacteriales bacterium SKADARSKE-1]|nr:hypothetical protein [Eubacteriales bacterium SKADARSKE-1]